jgi:8-oxo-dGTP diphosphatase
VIRPIHSPRVAAATVVFDDWGRILVFDRIPNGTTGGDDVAIPGGKLDPGELLMHGARRELFEETGVEAHSMTRLPFVTEDLLWGPEHHFVTHYFVVTGWSGTPAIAEPDKHRNLRWIEPDVLERALMPDSGTDLKIFDPLGHLVLDGGVRAALAIWERTR